MWAYDNASRTYNLTISSNSTLSQIVPDETRYAVIYYADNKDQSLFMYKYDYQNLVDRKQPYFFGPSGNQYNISYGISSNPQGFSVLFPPGINSSNLKISFISEKTTVLKIINCSGITIRDLVIEDCIGCINVENSFNIRIENCTFYNSIVPVYAADSQNIVVVNSNFYFRGMRTFRNTIVKDSSNQNELAALFYNFNLAQGVFYDNVTEGHIVGNVVHNGLAGFHLHRSRNIQVSRNVIVESVGTAIGWSNSSDNVDIHDNLVLNSTNTPFVSGSSSTNIQLQRNIIYSEPSFPVQIYSHPFITSCCYRNIECYKQFIHFKRSKQLCILFCK
eukprot:TRINITY_DN1_c7_g1_i1.p1 TRINITY_DN1_c7_g1~~TRINITY_DN1_c7_g1_i1.p1  ORF type:complete len:333 (-),score=28.53 TRINITY_DN1_c7_g1_i1:1434-2432(-)